MAQVIDVPGHGPTEFPDGMTDDQIVAAIKANAPTAKPQLSEAATQPEAYGMSGETSTGFNPAAALISSGRVLDKAWQGLKQATTTQRGMLQTLFGNDAGAELSASQAAQQSADEAQKDAAYKQLQAVNPGSTQLGELVPAIATPWRALPAVAAASYGTPTERLMAGGSAFVGNKLAGSLAGVANRQVAASETQAARTAAQNAVDQPLRSAGYVFPPAQANPTLPNQILSGLSGGAKNEQAASRVNQIITNQAARDALGLPKDAAITPEVLDAYRKTAYQQGYVPLKQTPTFATDQQYLSEIAKLKPALDQEVPEMAIPQIDKTITALSKPGFSGTTAVDLTRRLRSDANANFKAFSDPEKQALAQVQRGASDAIEGMMERNLAATGDQAKLSAFQRARQQIAQAHTIEDALKGDSVSAVALANSGAPLQGGLKTAAQLGGSRFAKSAQVINSETKANPFSVVDPLLMGGPALYASLAHGPLLGGAVLTGATVARPLLRAGLMSRPYQNLMTLPSEQVRGLLAQKTLNSPAAPYAAGLLGYEAGR